MPWTKAKLLAARTYEDHEFVDPTLSSEQALVPAVSRARGEGVHASAVQDRFRPSAERINEMLRGSTPQERRDMIGDNGLDWCDFEFCLGSS